MSDVTAPAVREWAVGSNQFADITPATLTAINPGPFGNLILTFDDSGAPLTANQIQQIFDRCASRNANEETIRRNARTAMVNNTAFLAIQTPSNAQVLAQVQAITRQVNGVIRVLLDQLDGTT